jgi:hypothetical protein
MDDERAAAYRLCHMGVDLAMCVHRAGHIARVCRLALEQRRFELSVPPPCRDAGGLALLRSA